MPRAAIPSSIRCRRRRAAARAAPPVAGTEPVRRRVGLAVRARLGLGHVDRYPLGDLAGTLAGVVAANPGVEVRARLVRGEREVSASTADADPAVSPVRGSGGAARAAARRLRQRINEGIAALGMRG